MEDKKLTKLVQQEEFNKLSQLDRIEYRQKEDRINKSSDFTGITFVFISFFFNFILLMSVLAFISNISPIIAVRAGILILRLFSVFYPIAFIIALLVDIVIFSRKKKEIESLKNEYFSLDLKLNKKFPNPIYNKKHGSTKED